MEYLSEVSIPPPVASKLFGFNPYFNGIPFGRLSWMPV